jgi:hypothetical protein
MRSKLSRSKKSLTKRRRTKKNRVRKSPLRGGDDWEGSSGGRRIYSPEEKENLQISTMLCKKLNGFYEVNDKVYEIKSHPGLVNYLKVYVTQIGYLRKGEGEGKTKWKCFDDPTSNNEKERGEYTLKDMTFAQVEEFMEMNRKIKITNSGKSGVVDMYQNRHNCNIEYLD